MKRVTNPPIILEQLPKSSDIHIWSDYIELLCLVSSDGLISKADVIDRLQEGSDIDLSIERNNEDADTTDERNNNVEQKADDWFTHLRYRAGIFNTFGFYPFTIFENGDGLYLKKTLTPQHKLYLFLLLASNLRYVPTYKHNITTAFEFVSYSVLKMCLPGSAEVHIFGTSAEKGGRYYGNLWKKINDLSKDIREKVLVTEEKFSPKNVGDGGLDIVGWVPTGDDTTGGLLCVFGQCACTEEWVQKQHSSSPESWRSILTLTSPPINVVFIPFCFRDSNGNWWKPQDIHQSVVFDRVRLIYFLRQSHLVLQQQPVYKDIENIIAYREPLI